MDWRWSPIELLYGFVVWAVLVVTTAIALRELALLPAGLSVTATVSLLSLGTVLLLVVVAVVDYLGAGDDGERTEGIF